MKRSIVLSLAPLASVALLAGARGVSAAAADATFSGSCTLTGTVSFDPPLTDTAQPTTSTADATGTCSGTLTAPDGTSQSLSNAALQYHATEFTSSASCNGAVDSGSGSFALAGFTFPFSVDEDRATGAAVLRLTGTEGGSAVADARIDPSASPVAILTSCAGAGLDKAPIDGDLRTTSPLASAPGKADAVRDSAADPRGGVAESHAATEAASIAPAQLTGLPVTSAVGGAGAGGAAALALIGFTVLARHKRRA